MNALELNHPYRYSERLLWICVVASMLLHVLVVLNLRGVEPPAGPPQPLQAVIRTESRPAPPPPAPAAPPQAVREPAKPIVPPEPPKAVPKPILAEKTPAKKAEPMPKPESAPAPPQPAPQAAPATAPSTAPATPATDAKTDAKSSVPASVPSKSNAEESAMINGYQAQLAQVAEKYKRYPADAIQQGWEGTVIIVLHIGADGMIANSAVETSTGHDLLDQKAREAALKAKPLVQVPAGLKGRPFEARLKLRFKLTE